MMQAKTLVCVVVVVVVVVVVDVVDVVVGSSTRSKAAMRVNAAVAMSPNVEQPMVGTVEWSLRKLLKQLLLRKLMMLSQGVCCRQSQGSWQPS